MDAKMCPHRDNYTKKAPSQMKMGIKKPRVPSSYAGVPNLHVEGANETTLYLELEGYSISCGNGTLTIVDSMDDLLMQHKLKFGEGEIVVSGDGKSETDCRLTESMKEAMEKSIANSKYDGKGRDYIYCNGNYYCVSIVTANVVICAIQQLLQSL
eukprot:scaffold110165_cov67-Cyclotella_meneghiniana.AAC.1